MIIYKVTNKVNNKSYIGKTKYSLKKRKSTHLSKVFSQNSNYAFHRAIRKYGDENFIWEVIDDTAKTIDELNEKEIRYIKEYNTFGKNGYNMTFGSDGGDTITNHPNKKNILKRKSDSQRGRSLSNSHKEKISNVLLERYKSHHGHWHNKKLSDTHKSNIKKTLKLREPINQFTIARDNGIEYIVSEETRNAISKANTGKKRSIETRLKIGAATKRRIPGMLGKFHSEKTKDIMRESALNRYKNNPNPFKGKTHTEETKQKLKNSWMKKEDIKCPYCDVKSISMSVMKRWHFDNCKHKP